MAYRVIIFSSPQQGVCGYCETTLSSTAAPVPPYKSQLSHRSSQDHDGIMTVPTYKDTSFMYK